MRRSLLCGAAVRVLLAASESLAATGTYTRDGLIKLTDANWQSTISKGTWLVEFYEPKSKSSEFFPTWDELVKTKASLSTDYPDAPFNFAQVDCFASADLCVREGVEHTPRLFTYVDGQKSQSQYQGNRAYPDLAAYVDREAQAYRHAKGVSDAPHPAPPPAAPAAGAPAEAKPADGAPKDGKPEAAAPPPPPPAGIPPPAKPIGVEGPNEAGTLIQFGKAPIENEDALARYLSKESGQGPTFVKFFAPWCPHCKAMAPAYKKLSETLKGKVNVLEVDCQAYRATCIKYHVQSFPTLRMYNKGRATEYRGGRSHDAMQEWALKAGSNAGLKEISSDELDAIVKEHEVFFLYLFSPGTPDVEQENVEKASELLMSKQTYAFQSSDPALLSRYSSYLRISSSGSAASKGAASGILVFKDHDANVPIAKFHPNTEFSNVFSKAQSIKEISTWLNAERFPTVSELTGTTFSDVIYNEGKALVVLAAVSDVHHGGNVVATGSGSAERDFELKVFKNLAQKWRTTPHPRIRDRVLFAWIDADRWATAVKTYYKIRAVDVPRAVLVAGSRLQYYDLPSDSSAAARGQAWLQEDAFFGAIEDALHGRVRAKSSKTYIDRSFAAAGGAVSSLVDATDRHPYISLALLIVFAAALFTCLSNLLGAGNTKLDRRGGGRSPLLPMTSSNTKLD